MSNGAVIDPPETFSATAMPLLREYYEKLQGIRNQLRVLKDFEMKMVYAKDTETIIAAEVHVIQEFLKRLRPAALDLSRQVSGMIDQGQVTPLERVEMKLRLAEFESILNELPRLIQAYRL
jgi:hypothetical protein